MYQVGKLLVAMFGKLKGEIRSLTETADRGYENAKGMAILAAIQLFGMLGLSGQWEREALSPFSMDNRGQMAMADKAVSIVVAIVVAGLLAAFLLPIAIEELSSVETTDWSDGAAAMWDILPLMVVLAIFLFFVTVALSQRRGR